LDYFREKLRLILEVNLKIKNIIKSLVIIVQEYLC
jgi:hypothetical protein